MPLSTLFRVVVVAEEKDQSVPSGSSRRPFDVSFHHVVPGDHLSMVKPQHADAVLDPSGPDGVSTTSGCAGDGEGEGACEEARAGSRQAKAAARVIDLMWAPVEG